MFSVNHFIVVQSKSKKDPVFISNATHPVLIVNPHVSPLLNDNNSMVKKVIEFGLGSIANELRFRIKQVKDDMSCCCGQKRFTLDLFLA